MPLPAASRIARRFGASARSAPGCESPTGCGLSGLDPDLARDEDEAVRLDRLGVRRALKRRRCRLGTYDLLHSPSLLRGRHAWASATPSALKIASSTCCVSRPSTRRTCSVRPAACANSSRNRAARSPAETARCAPATDRRSRRGAAGRKPRARRARGLRPRERRPTHGRARSVGAQRLGKRLAQRAAGVRDLGLGRARRHFEREVERRIDGERRQQVVEDRNAGGDVRLAASSDVDPRACAALPGRSHGAERTG